MGINYQQLRDRVFPVMETAYTERDTILYALGVGLGADPADEHQLRFVYEKNLLALPTMAVVLGYPGFWFSDPSLGLNWVRLLHGEQSIVLHQPLPPSGTVVGTNRVSAVVDKGAGSGALLVTERILTDKATGALLATLHHTAFCRDEGGFSAAGQPGDPALPGGAPVPNRPPDHVVDLTTRPESALLYRLSADRNPVHAEPALARAAGFARPILHGLCTFGVSGHALLAACCGYDPARLHGLRARFASPVYPGETIRTEIWNAADAGLQGAVAFRARVVERDVVVLDQGCADVSPLLPLKNAGPLLVS